MAHTACAAVQFGPLRYTEPTRALALTSPPCFNSSPNARSSLAPALYFVLAVFAEVKSAHTRPYPLADRVRKGFESGRLVSNRPSHRCHPTYLWHCYLKTGLRTSTRHEDGAIVTRKKRVFARITPWLSQYQNHFELLLRAIFRGCLGALL